MRFDLRTLLIASDLYYTRHSVTIDYAFSLRLVILDMNMSGISCDTNDEADDSTDNDPGTSCTLCHTTYASLISPISSISPERSISTAS